MPSGLITDPSTGFSKTHREKIIVQVKGDGTARKDYPKIQIVTKGLLTGTERIDAPCQINPFAMAARVRRA